MICKYYPDTKNKQINYKKNVSIDYKDSCKKK